MTERVCIVGCGAIGSMYAAHLARLPDLEVWAYDVSAEHVAAINEHGLRLTNAYDFAGPVKATTDPNEIPPCALGIIAVKGGHTATAAAQTAAIFTDGAVCSVQNGIGNEEVLAAHVPRVMRGVTLPAGRLVRPGVVEIYAAGPTWIGPFEPQPAATREIDRLARAAQPGGARDDRLRRRPRPAVDEAAVQRGRQPACAR